MKEKGKNDEKWWKIRKKEKKMKKKGNLLLFFQGILADDALHNSKHWSTSIS